MINITCTMIQYTEAGINNRKKTKRINYDSFRFGNIERD
jgi:hypothetical protein